MDKRKNIGIIGTLVAVIVAVVGVSVVWAAYTSSLTIKGTGKAEGAKWSVIFNDLGTVTLGNSAGVTATSKETSTPTITGDTSIENIGITVQTPGDFASYTFKIKNDGSFDAKISNGYTGPKLSCWDESGQYWSWPTSSEKGNNVAEKLNNSFSNIEATQLATIEGSSGNYFCNNYIRYTLTYTSDGSTVSRGDIIKAGEEKEVMLKLAYIEDVPQEELPKSVIELQSLNFTIPFEQA